MKTRTILLAILAVLVLMAVLALFGRRLQRRAAIEARTADVTEDDAPTPDPDAEDVDVTVGEAAG